MSTIATSRRVGVEEHLLEILAMSVPTPAVMVPVSDAAGLVLARDVRSPHPLPSFDNSAMDGYAVRAGDVAPYVPMPLDAEVAAGDGRPRRLAHGHAIPVMTGAPLPGGADAVVPVERSRATGREVTFLARPGVGDHIRRRGQERAAGALVASAGVELAAVAAGAVAAAGVPEVLAFPRPRVAVLSTGRELAAPGTQLTSAGVHDANTTLLTGLLRCQGATVTALDACEDDVGLVAAALTRAAATHDLLVTAGGISRGTHEVVRDALAHHGRFRTVAMSPGSPQGVGDVAGTPVVALPGNPSAALVSCVVFVRPLVRAMRGLTNPTSGWVHVRTSEPRPASDRTRFLPAVIEHREGTALARVCGSHHALSAFSRADAVLRLSPDAPPSALPLR